MQTGILEHVNVTVANPETTARMLKDVFGWKERWRGPAKDDGVTIHVGEAGSYIAIYTRAGVKNVNGAGGDPGARNGGLNHVGVVVADLAATERRVVAAGFQPHSHADYEPGRRFYFDDANGVEFEVVSYA